MLLITNREAFPLLETSLIGDTSPNRICSKLINSTPPFDSFSFLSNIWLWMHIHEQQFVEKRNKKSDTITRKSLREISFVAKRSQIRKRFQRVPLKQLTQTLCGVIKTAKATTITTNVSFLHSRDQLDHGSSIYLANNCL